MTFGDGSKRQGAFALASRGLTPGKLRGLQRIGNPTGTLTMLALDQNNSVVDMAGNALKRAGEDRAPTYEEVVEVKLALTRGLATAASAVLLDPYYGAWSAVASGAVPPQTGLLVRLERTRYQMSAKGAPLATMEPGFGVEKAKLMGADGVKLLVQFEPSEPESADANFALVQQVYEECRRRDLLLLLETLGFPLPGETKKDESYLDRKAETVVETARILSRYCDVYKAEFPGTLDRHSDQSLEDALHALDGVSERPWVLLSAGVDFEHYLAQVEMALAAGASGVLGGRAFWKEYFDQDDADSRARFLEEVGRKRIERVDELVRSEGSPWFARYGFSAEELAGTRAVEGWHHRYPTA